MPRKPRSLTSSEIDIILKRIAYRDDIGVSVALGLFCGLRVQEIAKTTRSDIKRSLKSGLWHVRKEIAKYGKPRTIPVCPLLAEILATWHNKHSTFNVRYVKLWNCSKRTVQRRFKYFSDLIGIRFTPHDLRHTFACALYNQCHDLSLVQAALGHTSLKSTLIYVHIDGIIQEQIEKAYKSFKDLPARRIYNDKIK